MEKPETDIDVDSLQFDFEIAEGPYLPPEISLENQQNDLLRMKSLDGWVDTPFESSLGRRRLPLKKFEEPKIKSMQIPNLNTNQEGKNEKLQEVESKYEEKSIDTSKPGSLNMKENNDFRNSNSQKKQSILKDSNKKDSDKKRSIRTMVFNEEDVIPRYENDSEIKKPFRVGSRKATRRGSKKMVLPTPDKKPIEKNNFSGFARALTTGNEKPHSRSNFKAHRKVNTFYKKETSIEIEKGSQAEMEDQVELNPNQKEKDVQTHQNSSNSISMKKLTNNDLMLSKVGAMKVVVNAPKSSEFSVSMSSTVKENSVQNVVHKPAGLSKHYQPNLDMKPNLQRIVEVSSMSNYNINESIEKRGSLTKSKEALDTSYNPDGNHSSFLQKKRGTKILSLKLKEEEKESASIDDRPKESSKSVQKSKDSVKSLKKNNISLQSIEIPPKQLVLDKNLLEELEEPLDTNNVTSVEKPLTKSKFLKKDTSSLSKPSSHQKQTLLDEMMSPVLPESPQLNVKISDQAKGFGLQKLISPTIKHSSFKRPKDTSKNDRTYNITVNESSDASLSRQFVPAGSQHQHSKNLLTPQHNTLNYTSFTVALAHNKFKKMAKPQNETLIIDESMMNTGPPANFQGELFPKKLLTPFEKSSPHFLGSRRSLILDEINDLENNRNRLIQKGFQNITLNPSSINPSQKSFNLYE